MSIPQKLTCPLTNCLYPVVSFQNPEVFIAYYRKIQNRLKQDEKIVLCVHCQTFFYGKNNDYITLIQMAEVSSKFKYEARKVPNDLTIKLKSGIILISPFKEDFITMLTNIFNSPKIGIITYDIFNQFSLLMSEGINFQFNKPIIDAEFTNAKGNKMFHQKYVHPILNCTTKKISDIKINKNNEINQFNYEYELQYKLAGVKNPFKNGFDTKFWKFFVKNCAFITIALISSVDQVGYTQQKEFTVKKLYLLSKTQDEYENYFVPLILKNFYTNKEFFSSNFEITKCPFKVWAFAQSIINNFDLYNTVVLENEDISKRFVNNLRRNAENAIHETDKNDSSSLQSKTKKGLAIVNSFVQKYGKSLNDLKLIWTVLQPKFQLIEAKLDPNDQVYRTLNEAFKNIKTFEATPQ